MFSVVQLLVDVIHTSVNNVVSMKVAHCVKDLMNNTRGVLLSELSIITDTIKKLSSGSKLRDNVVLVLCDN